MRPLSDHSGYTAQLPSVANRVNRSLANQEWEQAMKAGMDLEVIGRVVREYAQQQMQKAREP
jgi:hypothetical protein